MVTLGHSMLKISTKCNFVKMESRNFFISCYIISLSHLVFYLPTYGLPTYDLPTYDFSPYSTITLRVMLQQKTLQ